MHRAPVICDWMTGSHRYRAPVKPLEAGRTMKIDVDGCIEWETLDWNTIRCPSSDTSLRIRCDGERLDFSGNIGRFQHSGNSQGVGVVQGFERWRVVLRDLGLDVRMFGAVHHRGMAAESGTTLRRLDLAGNFEVSDYLAWCRALMARPIGRRHPMMGKYGPTWGYDAKRGQWWKAKVYDKSAEAAGLRQSPGGATLARFEVQLGSEWLRREGLQYLSEWVKERDMAQIIYGRFSQEVLHDSVAVEDWGAIPARLRQYAILWRDGSDLRTLFKSRSGFYKVKAALRDFGLDVGVPCNVVALTQRCRTVEVRPVSALRVAA